MKNMLYTATILAAMGFTPITLAQDSAAKTDKPAKSADTPTQEAKAKADEASPAVPVNNSKHKYVSITGDKGRSPNEVSIAINPKNPKELVSAFHFAHIFASKDGGLTWTESPHKNPGGRTWGDFLVAYGPDGKCYRAAIVFAGIFENRPAKAGNGIWVNQSEDGMTWKPAVPVIEHENTVKPFEDKPGIAIDQSDKSKHKGNIYLAWTRFDGYKSKEPGAKSHIHFSRSTNGGKSFSPHIQLSTTPGDCEDSDDTVMGAVVGTGPDGEVYVVWAGPKALYGAISTNGGYSFGKEFVVLKNPPGGWDIDAAGFTRHNGLPCIAVDNSNGPNRGSIYVNWVDTRHGDIDSFVTVSRDKGKTWSEPVRANDDPVGNKKDQLFSWMCVDQTDGSVNVAFLDRRGLENNMTGATLARSIDGGKTFQNIQVKMEPFKATGAGFTGDYNGIAAHAGRVVMAFSHFNKKNRLTVSAAVFQFKPGTMDELDP